VKKKAYKALPSAFQIHFISTGLLLLVLKVSGQTELFSHFNLILEGGLDIPRKELSDFFSNQPIGGIKLESPYYGLWKCQAGIQYCRLDYRGSNRDIHFVKICGGLFYGPKPVYLPSFGLELGSYSFKATRKYPQFEQLIDEFESEFGASPVVLWAIPLNRSVGLRLSAVWDVVFSEPQISHFYNILFGVRWRLW
jgi:hypothetical protein